MLAVSGSFGCAQDDRVVVVMAKSRSLRDDNQKAKSKGKDSSRFLRDDSQKAKSKGKDSSRSLRDDSQKSKSKGKDSSRSLRDDNQKDKSKSKGSSRFLSLLGMEEQKAKARTKPAFRGWLRRLLWWGRFLPGCRSGRGP
jgi:hypothetical protein